MTLKTLSKYLPGISDPQLLEMLLAKGKIVTFESGTSIMEPGQFIKMVPIVLEGAIKVMRTDDEGKTLFLYYIQPGETCALSLTCCSAARPSEIKAVAEEQTVILSIPVHVHEEWMHAYKQWKDYVSLTYQHRFQEMLEVLDAVAFKRMDERLMRYLLAKSKQLNTNELATTHQEIARELGTSREVISRLLKQLEKKKWIELGRNIIYIRDDFEMVIAQ